MEIFKSKCSKHQIFPLDQSALKDWASLHFSPPYSFLAIVVGEILVTQIGISLDQLDPESCFADINGLYDNFDSVDFMIALQSQFKLEIRDAEAEKIHTLADLITYLESRVNFIDLIKNKPFYQLIARKYQGKLARRSGVSYMNHIREGIFILYLLWGYDEELIEAYCIHPLVQGDKALCQLFSEQLDPEFALLSTGAVILAMEYRRVANSYTIKHKIRSADTIDRGPLEKVHKMLIADKIQNKKDFMKFMYLKHERSGYQKASEHALKYFDSWLEKLEVSPETYQEVIEKLEQAKLDRFV